MISLATEVWSRAGVDDVVVLAKTKPPVSILNSCGGREGLESCLFATQLSFPLRRRCHLENRFLRSARDLLEETKKNKSLWPTREKSQ